jgi:hypothetical protein
VQQRHQLRHLVVVMDHIHRHEPARVAYLHTPTPTPNNLSSRPDWSWDPRVPAPPRSSRTHARPPKHPSPPPVLTCALAPPSKSTLAVSMLSSRHAQCSCSAASPRQLSVVLTSRIQAQGQGVEGERVYRGTAVARLGVGLRAILQQQLGYGGEVLRRRLPVPRPIKPSPHAERLRASPSGHSAAPPLSRLRARSATHPVQRRGTVLIERVGHGAALQHLLHLHPPPPCNREVGGLATVEPPICSYRRTTRPCQCWQPSLTASAPCTCERAPLVSPSDAP